MKRKSKNLIPLVLLIFASLAMTSCAVPGDTLSDPFDPPGVQPSQVPSDWTVFENYGHPVEVTPVNSAKVPARHILLPENQVDTLLRPLYDGGALSLSVIPADDKDTSGNPEYFLRAVRFKADGSVLWDRRYDSDPFRGYAVTMCVFPDDGFAVSLRTTGATPSGDYADRLCRFSPDGTLLWQSKEGQVAASTLDYLFAAKDGAVLAAGTVPSQRGEGPGNGNDISLIRFERDSRQTRQYAVETNGFGSLSGASHANGTGIVLAWEGNANEGNDNKENDNKGPSDAGRTGGGNAKAVPRQTSRISCFNENLTLLWEKEMSADERLYGVQALPDGTGILAIGTSSATNEGAPAGTSSASTEGVPAETSSNPPEGTPTGTPSTPTGGIPAASTRSTLYCFDEAGERQWTYAAMEEREWVQTAARLTDGRFVIGVYRVGPESEESTAILIRDPEKKTVSSPEKPPVTLDTIPGIVTQLVATGDGGFTVMLRQTLRAILQPPYVSSIWTDTEAIVAHYERNLHLAWRRTIDQYKHSLRRDSVIPTVNDHLLIG